MGMAIGRRLRGSGWALALSGCAAHEVGPPPPAAERPLALHEVAREAVREEPLRSCRASAGAREEPLQLGDRRVEVGERSFVRGWRRAGADAETVLISIDAQGELVVTPVPVPFADPLAIGADAGGLVIVSVPLHGTGMLVRVVLDADGSLRPGTPVALPEIGWGWPTAIASDGSRALVQHTLSTPTQSLGDEVLYTVDLAAGRVVAAQKTGAWTQCGAQACTSLTMVGGTARLLRRTPAGDEAVLEVGLTSGCPAMYAVGEALLVLPGAPWRALEVTAGGLREVGLADTLTPIAGCGARLLEFPSRRWPGLVSDGSLLRWDAGSRRFGAAEGLPRSGFERIDRFESTDGVIEIGWRGGSAMAHSPTDAQGRRRDYEHWYFTGGEVRMLRREAAGFMASDAAPLALAEATGTMHDGYAPTLLRNGAHAGVLIAAQGGGEMSWWQPYRVPCAER